MTPENTLIYFTFFEFLVTLGYQQSISPASPVHQLLERSPYTSTAVSKLHTSPSLTTFIQQESNP